MKTKKLLWVITGILLVLVFLIIFKSNYTKSKLSLPSTPTPTPSPLPNVLTNMSQEELQQYYDTYKKPYVVTVRTALDAYLAHDSSNACIMQVAVDSVTDMGIVTGLDSFSEEYYKSKFVVVTIDDSKLLDNAKDIQILFQGKPDRIFYALVGFDPTKPDSKEYCLLGFNSKVNMDQEALQNAIEFYGPLMFDKEHAL